MKYFLDVEMGIDLPLLRNNELNEVIEIRRDIKDTYTKNLVLLAMYVLGSNNVTIQNNDRLIMVTVR